jgi:hypothetical protein
MVRIGLGLICFTVLLLAIAAFGFVSRMAFGAFFGVVLPLAAIALVALLWLAAIRNGADERGAVARLRAAHPGAFVERVRLWSLPSGLVPKNAPMHFVVADPDQLQFVSADGTSLAQIPVGEIGLIDFVTAQKDKVRDKALTIIYGDEQDVVQVFPDMNLGLDKLNLRVRKAIGWPADGAP